MATIEGAKAVGLEKLIGSLTPGKRADLITVDLKASTPVTPENLIAHLVVFGDGGMVRDAIVNGKEVMKERTVIRVDEDFVREKCVDAARSLWESQ